MTFDFDFDKEPPETNPRLKPPLNVRPVMPHVCGSCKHHVYISGTFQCQRPDGPGWDAGEFECWFHTCDRWAQP